MLYNKPYIAFKQLPGPIRFTTCIYFACLLGYNILGTYHDSKLCLLKYREGNLRDIGIRGREFNEIRDEWSAVKYGARKNMDIRLWDSIIWPITGISNIVPAIVLALNSETKKE